MNAVLSTERPENSESDDWAALISKNMLRTPAFPVIPQTILVWHTLALKSFAQAGEQSQLPLLGGHGQSRMTTEVMSTFADKLSQFVSEAVSRSRVEVALSLAVRRLNLLESEVSSLKAAQTDLEGRLTWLEQTRHADAQRQEETGPKINWTEVESVARDAASSLGWEATIGVEEESLQIRVILPESQEDELVERSGEFYEILASSLGNAEFRALSILVDIDEES